MPKPAYPVTAKGEVVDTLHGVHVKDPYRWLEDDNSPETKVWVEAQNRLTFGFLERIPERSAIRERLTKLWNYERYGVPFRRGGRLFFTRNDGLQNQNVFYVMDSDTAEPRLLLDPNTLSTDGTVALTGYNVSEDGRLLAYGVARAGSDWQEWRVREVETGADRPDFIEWVKFSGVSWTHDGRGFYYCRYDAPSAEQTLTKVNYFHKLYHHRLGAPPTEDTLVYHRPDQKEWLFDGHVTEDGRYLIITVSQGTDPKNRVFYKDLQSTDAKVVELLNDFDAAYNFVDSEGPVFFFHTDQAAPRGRVIAIDAGNPDRAAWREIVPQSDKTIQTVGTVGQYFFVNYLADARTRVRVVDLEGRFVRDVALPGPGSAGGFEGRRTDAETFFYFTNFTTPTAIYRHDPVSGKSSIFRRPKTDFDPSDFETRQVFYTSRDGTRVPLFVSHKKGLKLDGHNPTLLYGYGGFNISLNPGFSASNLVFMERGGVYAVANLRGGGEYGEEWHQAGTRLKKQNVFDDFIAAAEWLVANKVTSSSKLAIAGGSNGGLLVGACMTQRPDLFGAALPSVGVMDMLRFHKFTIGWAWVSDYGTPDDPEAFAALYAYSPLHNLKSGVRYPATLITTADHDDRVVPAHSFKFAARLQETQAGDAPVLIRIETKAGHGAGKPTDKLIEEGADRLAFLTAVLGR